MRRRVAAATCLALRCELSTARATVRTASRRSAN